MAEGGEVQMGEEMRGSFGRRRRKDCERVQLGRRHGSTFERNVQIGGEKKDGRR